MGNWREFLKPEKISRKTAGYVGLDFDAPRRTGLDRRRHVRVQISFISVSNDDLFQNRVLYSVKDFARGVNRERFSQPFFDRDGKAMTAIDVFKMMSIEPIIYRVMVNPLDDVVTVRFVQEFMARCGEAIGRGLLWAAAIHDKPTVIDDRSKHCHIMLAGRDKAGKPVRLSRNFKVHGFRYVAEALATEILGPMTDDEVVMHRDRMEAPRSAIGREWAPPTDVKEWWK